MRDRDGRVVSWFSCGAASACAAKLAVERWGEAVEVVYCDMSADEHPDNQRFSEDVQAWLGQPVRRIKSEKYSSVDDVFARFNVAAASQPRNHVGTEGGLVRTAALQCGRGFSAAESGGAQP